MGAPSDALGDNVQKLCERVWERHVDGVELERLARGSPEVAAELSGFVHSGREMGAALAGAVAEATRHASEPAPPCVDMKVDVDVRAAWADEVEDAVQEGATNAAVDDAIQARREVWALRASTIGLPLPGVASSELPCLAVGRGCC